MEGFSLLEIRLKKPQKTVKICQKTSKNAAKTSKNVVNLSISVAKMHRRAPAPAEPGENRLS
jgi:hypothetical protein